MCKEYFVLRVSTQERKSKDPEQKKTQQEFDRQLFVFRSHGYNPTPENTVEDRVSGGCPFEERPNFSELLDRVEQGSTIHFCEVTRFSRDYIDGMRLIDYLLFTKKVNIVFVSENRTLYADKRFNKDEWLFISMQLLWAEYRKREIGEYTSQALRAKREKLGDAFNIGHPKSEVDPEIVQTIKDLFGKVSVSEIQRRVGISRRIVDRVIREECK